jgi:enterobactin synthetase component D / holo-[acyl-carrier protein] synthase
LRVGPQREPLWPEGFVGSITHTTGLCLAVVADRKRFMGLGVDIEIAGGVTPELWPSICTDEERSWLGSLPDDARAAAATLVFAAKEAFYKAQFPLARERLLFHEVRIEVPIWDARQGSFVARTLRPVRLAQLVALPLGGAYRSDGEYMAAGIAIGAPANA